MWENAPEDVGRGLALRELGMGRAHSDAKQTQPQIHSKHSLLYFHRASAPVHSFCSLLWKLPEDRSYVNSPHPPHSTEQCPVTELMPKESVVKLGTGVCCHFGKNNGLGWSNFYQSWSPKQQDQAHIKRFNKGTCCKHLGGAVTTWARKDKGSK